MLKLTLDYVNFDGETRRKDLYFNISMRALAEKELRANGTWFDSLKAIVEADKQNEADGNVIMDRFYEIISLAYGERSEDGELFRQSPAIWEAFEASAAYDAFFMKICTDAGYAAEFINAVLPAHLIEAVKKQQAEDEAKKAVLLQAANQPVIPTQPSAPVVWPPQEH